jgi:hypothetical protein
VPARVEAKVRAGVGGAGGRGEGGKGRTLSRKGVGLAGSFICVYSTFFPFIKDLFPFGFVSNF